MGPQTQPLMPAGGQGFHTGGMRFAQGGAGLPHPDAGLFWLHDIFLLLFLVAVIAGIILVTRMILNRPHHVYGYASPAVAELELRYARGDINRDEYWQRRADLTGSGAVNQPAPPATTPGGKKS